MGLPSALALGLLVLGALGRAPGLLLIGVLALLVGLLTRLWSRFGLRRLRYERRLAHDRAVVGDSVPLDLVVRNEKLLPLPFVRSDDFVTDDLTLRERAVTRTDRPGLAMIDEAWSIGWFQQVVRHRHVLAERRGIYRFGPVRLRVADLFGRDAAMSEGADPALLLVRPRTLPIRMVDGRDPTIGERQARRGLHEDPALYAGIRPFQQGDPLRRVHWRASARLGRPVSRRYDPAQERHALVVLDVQTMDEPHWVMAFDEALAEGLVVVAGSLARRLLADGVACGVAAAAWTGTLAQLAFLAPGAGPDQLGRVTDLLARLSPFASAPFSVLLARLPGRVPVGATLHVLSGRDPGGYLPTLRRLVGSGYDVRFIGLGPSAAQAARRARAAGLPATIARVEPDWRTATAVELAG